MDKVEWMQLPIPHSLNLVNSKDQLKRVQQFRKQEYTKLYQNIEINSHDPFDCYSYILFSTDKMGQINGTARLVMDTQIGLPEDALFPPDIHQYRLQGKKLMEIGRFMIYNGNLQLLKSYYRAFYDIASACEIDYLMLIMRRKDLGFHRKLFGIDVLIESIEENFGSHLDFMCVGWDVTKTQPSFFKWTASILTNQQPATIFKGYL